MSTTEPIPVDTAELLTLAIEVATAAGRLIEEERPEDLGVDTKSSRTDVVTVMDTRAQRLIADRLAAARPGDGFHGEEEGAHRDGSTGITWVVDPIDGTVNYLYDIPAYAVSVAAVLGDPRTQGAWQPVAGAVVNPTAGECFSAAIGAGAHLRDRHGRTRTLRVNEVDDLGLALVATGFSYDAGVRSEQATALTAMIPRIRDIRRNGSAALDLCQLAAGRIDAYYERRLNPWDIAAGILVATEAGAVIGGPRGRAHPDGDLLWAAAPALAEPFVRLLAEAGAAGRSAP